MRTRIMSKRMTWQEICEQYPNQQVALEDVEWVDNDGVTVKTASVRYCEKDMSRTEIIAKCMMSGGKLFSNNTTESSMFVTGLCRVVC